jgi:glutathione S-transferase
VLTEWPAIATWIASRDSTKRLLPDDEEGQIRAIEAIDYIVATVHMQGFSRCARPGNFAPNEADHEAVKARGLEIFGNGLKILDQRLAGKDFIVGNKIGIADFAVFYVSFWAAERLKQKLPPNLAAHYARMRQRPAVQRVLVDEGFQA